MAGYKNPPDESKFKPGQSGNPHGRPKSFKQLRALVVSIASEPVKDGDEKTRIEDMIRRMIKSDNPTDKALALKYGFGNVPDELEVKHSGKIKLQWPEDDAK
jgi:hypothetical protein